MAEEVTPSPEGSAETGSAPVDLDKLSYPEYERYRSTGELPQKAETPSAAAAEEPPAKTESESEPEEAQEPKEEPEPEASEDEEEPEPRKRVGSRQRRIDRLTREVEELKRQLTTQAKPAEEPATAKAKPDATQKPKLEDFETLEAYQEALTDWKLDQREQTRRETEERQKTEEAAREAQIEWTKKEKAARRAHADFDEVLDTVMYRATPAALAVRQALLEDENGAEILYYLGKHPDEIENITALPPASAILAIGRISAQFKKPSSTPENGKPKVSSAPKPLPAPTRPVKTSSDSIYDEEVNRDFRRYMRAREAQLKR